MDFATKEGTFTHLKKFPKLSKAFYRFNGELFFSSLGLGTFRKEPYREENYVINYKEALKKALLSGVNFIDTAINYRYQVSEKEIGEALKELMSEGKIKRDGIIISSKAGFIPLEFPFPKDPYKWIEENILNNSLATKDEIVIDQHCMSVDYLRWSLNQSLHNLGLKTLDIFFLHNPETQLGYVKREVVIERIKESFKLFEEFVKEGKIKYYGIASWNAFLYEETHTEYLSIKELVELAQEVGGENHHFRYIQSPFNLAKTHAYTYTNQKAPDNKYYTTLQIAKGYGLSFIASSSLLQMNLFKGKFNDSLREELGTKELSDIGTALQFARSGGVLSALFGSIDPTHIEENLLLSYLKDPTNETINQIVRGKNAI